jgi:NitT/TauT family transport system permease protein
MKIPSKARPWVAVAGLLAVWELACRGFDVPVVVLPAPSEILAAVRQFHDPLLMHGLQTLATTVAGFLIAIVVGVAGGIVIGTSRAMHETFYPLLIGFNAIPKVALVPVIVVWFGIGTLPAVVTAFVISFFPILVNVATGLGSVEPEMRDVLRVLGATRWEVLRKVGLPRTMPFLFAALKVSVTLAFIGSVVSETVASNSGIGYLMLAASSRYQVPLVFAGLLVVAAMSIALYLLCVLVERRVTGWASRGQP